MFFSNGLAILILSFLFGAMSVLSSIGSLSFLLAQMPPVTALYINCLASVCLMIFFKKVRLEKIRFAWFSLVLALAYLILLISLTADFYPAPIKASLWYFLYLISSGIFYWVLVELALKYLDPVRSHSYFTYIITASECGCIAVILALKVLKQDFSPNQMIGLSSLFLFVFALIVGGQFLPKNNLEIRSIQNQDLAKKSHNASFSSLTLLFFALTVFMGFFKASEDYLFKGAVKQELQSYEKISELLTTVQFWGSLGIMSVSFFLGRLIQKKRLSPLLILFTQTFCLIFFAFLGFYFNTLVIFIVFDLIRRIAENSFFMPANQTLISSFTGAQKNTLRSVNGFYALSAIPMTLLFTYTSHFEIELERKIVFAGIGFSLLFLVFILIKFREKLTHTLYELSFAENTEAASFALHTLSYLQPKNFQKKTQDLLNRSPKDIVRKTIILGLGFTQQDEALEMILSEFDSPKEKIQIAVLDALKTNQTQKAQRFLIRVMTGEKKAISLRVRLHAITSVSEILGKKAIPFLLNGLEDSDVRVVANTLEALSTFKDKSLIPIFKNHLESTIMRIRANACLGLAVFANTREIYQNYIRQGLSDTQPDCIASFLYVIGKLRDDSFVLQLERIKNSALFLETPIQCGLAWAWTRLRNEAGYELFAGLLANSQDTSCLHLFSQLKKEQRFDVIKYAVIKYQTEVNQLKQMKSNLEESVFDFRQEQDYLEMLQ